MVSELNTPVERVPPKTTQYSRLIVTETACHAPVSVVSEGTKNQIWKCTESLNWRFEGAASWGDIPTSMRAHPWAPAMRPNLSALFMGDTSGAGVRD
jgi:hypothetical protein